MKGLLKTILEKEKILLSSIFSFSLIVYYSIKNKFTKQLKHFYNRLVHVFSINRFFALRQTFRLNVYETKLIDTSKLKELADDNFKFDKDGRFFSQSDRKHCGNWRKCLLRETSPFSMLFSKDLYCRHIKIKASLGKG